MMLADEMSTVEGDNNTQDPQEKSPGPSSSSQYVGPSFEIPEDGDSGTSSMTVVNHLPPLPSEEELFPPKNKRKVLTEHNLYLQTEAIVGYLDTFLGFGDFAIKDVWENVPQVKGLKPTVYDICNVFEAVGLLTKSGVGRFRWLGLWNHLGGNLAKTLAQLKAIASIPGSQTIKSEDYKENGFKVQAVTERILMLFLANSSNRPGEGKSLTTHELFAKFGLGDDVATKEKLSGRMKLVKVLKILGAIGLLRGDGAYCKNKQKFYHMSYTYVGPAVDSADISNISVQSPVRNSNTEPGHEVMVETKKPIFTQEVRDINIGDIYCKDHIISTPFFVNDEFAIVEEV